MPEIGPIPEGTEPYVTPPTIYGPTRSPVETGIRVLKRAQAGFQQAVGGLAEMMGLRDWGRRVQAESLANLSPEMETGAGPVGRAFLQAGPSVIPSLSFLLPGVGPELGLALTAGQVYGQPQKWNVPGWRRYLSTGAQTGTEFLGNVPEMAIANAPLPPQVKGPGIFLSSLLTNPVEEGVQGELEQVIERSQTPSFSRAVQTAKEAIPATLALSALGAGVGALRGGGAPESVRDLDAQVDAVVSPEDGKDALFSVTPLPKEQRQRLAKAGARLVETSIGEFWSTDFKKLSEVARADSEGRLDDKLMGRVLYGVDHGKDVDLGTARTVYRETEDGKRIEEVATDQENEPGTVEQISQRSTEGDVIGEEPVIDTIRRRASEKDLEARAALVIGDGDPELTRHADEIAQATKADWEIAKRGVVPHGETLDVGSALAARVGYKPEEIKKILSEGGAPAATGIAAASIASRYHVAKAVESKSTEDFAREIADAGNLLVAARAAVSEQGRGLSFWGWAQREAGRKLDELSGEKPVSPGEEAQPSHPEETRPASVKSFTEEATSKARESVPEPLTPEDIHKIFGGPKELKKLHQDINLAVERETLNVDNLSRAMNAILEGARRRKKKSAREKAGRILNMPLEWFRAMLLTGPATDQVNVFSTLANIALNKAIVDPVAAGVNVFTKAPDQQSLPDQLKGASAVFRSLSDIPALAYYGALAEYPSKQLRRIVLSDQFRQQEMLALSEDKFRQENEPSIPGGLGRFARNASFSKLSAEDAALRSIVIRAETAAEMSRKGLEWDGISEVPANVMASAVENADKLTFNQKLHGLSHHLNEAVKRSYIARFVVPFTRTAMNIIKEGVSFVPGLNLASAEYRKQLATPHSRAQNEALAKMVVGTGLFSLVAALRSGEDPDEILGAPPPGKGSLRNIWYLENGNLSVKAGGTQFEIYRMEPLNIILGSMIAAVDALNQKDKDALEKVSDAAIKMARTPLNMHMLVGISRVITAFQRAEDTEAIAASTQIAGMLKKMGAAMLVPQIAFQAGQFMDRFKRQADPKSFSEQLKIRIPGLRQTLPSRPDITGRAPIPEGRYHDLFTAIPRRPIKDPEPVARELLRVGRGLTVPDWTRLLPPDDQAYVLQERWNLLEDNLDYYRGLDRDVARDRINRVLRKWAGRGDIRALRALARQNEYVVNGERN